MKPRILVWSWLFWMRESATTPLNEMSHNWGMFEPLYSTACLPLVSPAWSILLEGREMSSFPLSKKEKLHVSSDLVPVANNVVSIDLAPLHLNYFEGICRSCWAHSDMEKECRLPAIARPDPWWAALQALRLCTWLRFAEQIPAALLELRLWFLDQRLRTAGSL